MLSMLNVEIWLFLKGSHSICFLRMRQRRGKAVLTGLHLSLGFQDGLAGKGESLFRIF